MRATKPTRKQKMSIKKVNLNPDNWLVVRDGSDGLLIRHKVSGKERTI